METTRRRASPIRRRLSWMVMVILAMTILCSCQSETQRPTEMTEPMPSWLESVYPEPGAAVAVPDAVEVDHSLQGPDEDVRLVVDGVDVTTYASFDAGKIRYEPGVGPVTLGPGDHTAEVERVTLPADGSQFEVLDTFTWEFRTS